MVHYINCKCGSIISEDTSKGNGSRMLCTHIQIPLLIRSVSRGAGGKTTERAKKGREKTTERKSESLYRTKTLKGTQHTRG